MCIIDCLSTIVFILPLHLDYTKVIILILWWRNFQLEYWRTFQLVSTLRVPTHSRLLCLSGLHGYPEVTAQRAERVVCRHRPAKADESPAIGQPSGDNT